MVAIYPVILCGGAGTRLWPSSRADRPKQFLPLVDALSSFQQTLVRLADADCAQPVIVTGAGQAHHVHEQLAALGLRATVIIEPEARDSAPAVAAAAAFVLERDPDGIVLMLAADHHVGDVPAFVRAVGVASAAAAQGYIATFGVTPDHPATGFGYIKPGRPVMDGVFEVAAFVEKPQADVAARYVADGYFWNSGNFAFKASVLIGELEVFDPATAAAARACVALAVREGDEVRLDPEAFAQTTRKSLDYAVMEKTAKAVVAPSSFDWSDLGAWDAIWTASARDAQGNAAFGDVRILDSRNSLIHTSGRFVGVIGLDDLVVVAEDDAVLVCRRDNSQSVKTLVDGLKAEGRAIASRHGSGLLLSEAGAQVSILRLAAGALASLEAGSCQVLSGEIKPDDGTLLTAGGHVRSDAAFVVIAQSDAVLLVTVWTA